MKGSIDMKRVNSSAVVFVVTVCALWFASASPSVAKQSRYSQSSDATFANSLADGGSIRMKHSPVLGINIAIAVRIDGMVAGSFAKGHVYQRYLTPGRHDVSASRNGPGRAFDTWHGTLDVRRGETYSFVVNCTSNHVILTPVSRVDGPSSSDDW
jgi:hypothetical protein